MQTEMLTKAGKSPEEIRAQVEATVSMQTPFLQGLFGAIGTVVTGLLSSLAVAAFARKRWEAFLRFGRDRPAGGPRHALPRAGAPGAPRSISPGEGRVEWRTRERS